MVPEITESPICEGPTWSQRFCELSPIDHLAMDVDLPYSIELVADLAGKCVVSSKFI